MVQSHHSFHSLSRPSTTPRVCNSDSSTAACVFSDVAGDITILIDGEYFQLHKFAVVSRSRKIGRMVADSKDSKISKLELFNLPGGPQAFELAAKFCYGANFEITTANVAQLRCAAEYLEMTEDYREENLIVKAETYLNEVVVKSLKKSMEVLCACETLPPIVEDLNIPSRCVEAIATNARKEQLLSGLTRLGSDDKSFELKNDCIDWWVGDLSVLRIDYYHRVISAMGKQGVRSDSITASIMLYAQSSLRNKTQVNEKPNPGVVEDDERRIVEVLVTLLPVEKSSCSSIVPSSFLFGLLRMAVMVNASTACRLELERRIGFQLQMVSLDDLLIPSTHTGDSLFDVDIVHRILINFVQKIEEQENEDPGYESEGHGDGASSQCSVLIVGRLVDEYLAEIAPDPYLNLQSFITLVELLPDYARVMDDGLYRAIDIYLKAHPLLTEHERKELCKFIDCQKLSQEAWNHAVQNDRLPVQMAVRVLYYVQLRLKDALSGSCGKGFLSQSMGVRVPSAAMLPRKNYATLRRENRELKLEISRMRVRLSELEREQLCMKRGLTDKTGDARTFFTMLSRGIGRIGIFSGQAGDKKPKSERRTRGLEGRKW